MWSQNVEICMNHDPVAKSYNYKRKKLGRVFPESRQNMTAVQWSSWHLCVGAGASSTGPSERILGRSPGSCTGTASLLQGE